MSHPERSIDTDARTPSADRSSPRPGGAPPGPRPAAHTRLGGQAQGGASSEPSERKVLKRCIRLVEVLICSVLSTTIGQTQARAQVRGHIADSVAVSIGDLTDVLFPSVTNLRVGLGSTISPDYEGSDDYHVRATPLVSLRYSDVIKINNNNVSVNVVGIDRQVGSDRFRAGPEFRIDSGRDESDSPDLAGLGDTGIRVELGVYGSYTRGRTRTRIRIFHNVANGHSGTRVVGDVRLVMLERAKVAVIGSISGTWADSSYMETFFGVNQAQSQASGLPVFNAGAGIKDARIGISVNYRISHRWALVVHTDYERLLRDAADSPIVSLRGSPNQATGALFMTYAF